MNEANRSSFVSEIAWISAGFFVTDIASATTLPTSADVDHRMHFENAPDISPSADVTSTSTSGFVPVCAPLPYERWHFEIFDRMDALFKKQDGRKGPDSLGASPLALEHANHFLRKLAMDKIDRRPAVGLDYEGTFSFVWSDGNLSIDLTVYDDGTYSYFATDGVRSATADNAFLSEKISPEFLSLLLS